MYLTKDLYSEHMKNFYNSDKKTNYPTKKQAKDFNRHVYKNILMANKHKTKCSTILVTRKMQLKTTIFTLTSMMARLKMKHNNKCWRWELGEIGMLITADVIVEWCGHFYSFSKC